MRTSFRRAAGRAVLILVALIGAGVLAFGAYLVRPVSTAPFRDAAGRVQPGSIASMERWRINGVDQSVTLRGRDRRNPILVWVHGGPGTSETGVLRRYDSELEDRFVLVLWDQRYAGRSLDPFGPKPANQAIDDYVSDLDVLIGDLQRRFACRKVVLVAHSWGTVPGLLYAERHPEKLAAYVGIGQEADALESERRSYAFVLGQARARRDAPAIERLERMGPPPRRGADIWTPRTLLEKYGGAFHGDASELSLVLASAGATEMNWRDGAAFLLSHDFNVAASDAEAKVVLDVGHTHFQVPMFFLSGRTDHVVDAPLTFAYLQKISAPRKAFVWFEQSGHYPPFEEPRKFNAWMTDNVLPLARGACTGAGD
ncbi:MAG: alpha/beta fold hydrolase [Caulobacterales bacterium]